MSYETIGSIYEAAMNAGYSADNLTTGSGGALAQIVNRDTQKFAFKCSSITINGKERDVFKDPITDHGKISKKGHLCLYENSNGEFLTYRKDEEHFPLFDSLKEVFCNGEVHVNHTFAEVRARAAL